MELLGQGPPDFSVAPKSMSFSFGPASEPLPFSYFGEVGESTGVGEEACLSLSYVCESEKRDCKEANASGHLLCPGWPLIQSHDEEGSIYPVLQIQKMRGE